MWRTPGWKLGLVDEERRENSTTEKSEYYTLFPATVIFHIGDGEKI